MTSLGGSTVAFQALDALRMTGGSAVAVQEAEVVEDQRRLGRHGLYLELSSAVGMTGLRALMKRGVVQTEAHAVIVATSHGYKDEPAPNSSNCRYFTLLDTCDKCQKHCPELAPLPVILSATPPIV